MDYSVSKKKAKEILTKCEEILKILGVLSQETK
jgi:hypothetical protein